MTGARWLSPRRLGAILHWPGGYAMNLGVEVDGNALSCCHGHESPEAAREHGIIRAIEIAQSEGAADVAAWAAESEASA